jgi:hypothetical protein
MSKNNGPVQKLWEGSLLILGAVIAISLSLSVLEQIWGWLLLIAGIVGALVGGVFVLRHLANNSSGRW